ncbi:uncharacterized protein FSUBG_6216 [Fusarium subglutinans]|uniref:Nephrocystin 3-like N-terminal domain-containing protein n=1 Tax=Gibberella subglutinans TaxID=42677 RepID=A0A8H5V2U2_GIBSU|nr:uncharacterized protein FSUBG_6216 [Fusarium subglutinans]KAF5606199.1 hypothetical protein FSUBG_6216 [Fusarium subglutinans]
MADPLSMTASIAGVIALSDLVFKTVFSYTYKAKEAKKDAESLKEEISGLSNALRILDALAYELEAENGPRDVALNTKLLDQCRETLTAINQKVQKAVKDFDDACKWKHLSRCKATISLAASADSLSKLQTVLSHQVTHNTKIEELVQKVYQKSVITASILLDREKQRILEFFMKPNLNPQPSLDQSIKWRHPTTGNWLLSSTELQTWFAKNGSLVWLNGIPGGGKNILAGLVIQEALSRSSSEVGVAFFFCDYKNTESLIPTKILGAIASQLALQNEESFEHLEECFNKLCPSRALSKEPEVADLRDTIAAMIKTFRQVLIIVDGLDECGDEMSNVTSCLSDLAGLAEPAAVALFSRNEMQIRSRMGKNFTEIPIEAHTEDIENYVRSELGQRIQSCRLLVRKSETRDAIQHELIDRAHGMFRWVSCQLGYLCEFGTDHDRLQALKELPPTLPDSYRRILERLNTRPAKIRKMVQLCLHFVAFFPARLTVLELCQAISTPDEVGAQLSENNTYIEDDVILHCSSLIRKSADGRGLEFSRFTVREFLETEIAGLEEYRISRPNSTSLMALNCLRFLQLKNINVSVQDQTRFLADLEKVDSSLPFYRHAAAYWPITTILPTHLLQISLLETGYGLLHRIASLGQEPQTRWLMEALVRRGVDINGINANKDDISWRNSPLVHHLRLGSTCYAGYLLEMGADPSVCPNDTVGINCLDAPSCAGLRDNLCFLEQLLTVSQESNVPVRWNREVSLILPMGNGNLEIQVNSLGLASFFGYIEIVKFFIEKKLFTIDMTSKGGATCLHLAALGGQSRIIEYLMDHEHPVDAVDEYGNSPLHYAAVSGHLDATKILLSKGARESNALGSWTPKMAAQEHGHHHIVELLDKEPGCYNESDPDPVRAQRHVRGLLRQMETAVLSNDFEGCRNAVISGCPLNGIMPQSGCTPLLFALIQGRFRIVAWLVDRQASTLVQCDLSDGQRSSAINIAANDPKLLEVLYTMIHRYTEQGGDLVNGPDAPIFFAARKNVRGLRILLDYLQKHMKHWSRDNTSRRQILDRRFLSRRLNTNAFDEVTALHVAVLNDNLTSAELLLENGANIDSLSAHGFTIIELSQSPEMTALLLKSLEQ